MKRYEIYVLVREAGVFVVREYRKHIMTVEARNQKEALRLCPMFPNATAELIF